MDEPQANDPGIYSRRDVLALTTLSKATLWRRIAAGDFPKPVRLSPGRVGWPRAAVHAWLRNRSSDADFAKGVGR